jgi:hypothetical protein
MALSMTALHKQLCNEFNTIPSDPRFQSDFIFAANLCLDELSFAGDLATAIDHIASLSDTVDELDTKHSFLLHDGLVVKLVESGRPHRASEAYDIAMRNWNDRKGDFLTMEQRDLAAAVDDDSVSSTDLVGLGYLGDV